MKYDIVIIGASAAGITAALTAKKHYPDKSVLVIRNDKLVPIPCGIPYALGFLGDPEKNLIPVDTLLPQNNIDSMVEEVVDIEQSQNSVKTQTGKKVEYERLVLATGSIPIVPPIQGVEKKNIFAIKKNIPYLKTLLDGYKKAESISIVGCGFIGVEIAEECRKQKPDIKISIVEMLPHCLQMAYDKECCVQAEDALKEQKISLLLNEKVSSFNGSEKVEKIVFESGKEHKTDFVILGIGSKANISLATKANLEIGPTKGIQVNRYMQTSNDKIFACGDCAEKVSFFDGKPSTLKLASIATMEARIAAANLFMTSRINMGVIGVYSTIVKDCAFASAGMTKSQAEEKGYEVIEGEAKAVNRHPESMPGGAMLKVKLIFEAGTQTIIGGQVTGAKSGGELINIISVCIQRKMTADDIATFQTGTHPALTASPISYQLVNAAEMAIKKLKTRMFVYSKVNNGV
jgi:NADH oxidase (H2O2-forming)